MPDVDFRFQEFCGHIVEWGERIPDLIGSRDFDGFVADQSCYLSVWKCVEVLGEASAKILKLPGNFEARYPGLPLRRAYAMRNQLTHGYGSIDLGILWATATKFVPPMVEEAKKIISAYD